MSRTRSREPKQSPWMNLKTSTFFFHNNLLISYSVFFYYLDEKWVRASKHVENLSGPDRTVEVVSQEQLDAKRNIVME